MNINDLPQGSYKPVGQPLNINNLPQGSYTPASSAPAGPDFLDKAVGAVKASPIGFVAPLGSAIGNSLGGLFQAGKQALKGDFKGAGATIKGTADQNNSNFSKIVGSTAASVALPASLALGGAPTALGRIGASAGLNAVLGGGTAAAGGSGVADTAKATGLGGLIGAGGQAVGEGINTALSALPSRLTKLVLPKLDAGNTEYALKNTKVGTIKSLLSDSQSSVANLGEQVQTILKHPEYAADTGAGDFAVQKTLHAFPNSNYTPEQIVSTVKGLVPAQAKIVEKVADGTATLLEKNTLRQSIDPIIKKAFTDAPELTANKEIGLQFANALRGEVQAHAPETQPIFANLSKEINLRNALHATSKKLDAKSVLGLYDITAALAGLTTGNPAIAAGAVGLEKAARSPAVNLAAAKAIPKVLPTLNTVGKLFKVGATVGATSGTPPTKGQ